MHLCKPMVLRVSRTLQTPTNSETHHWILACYANSLLLEPNVTSKWKHRIPLRWRTSCRYSVTGLLWQNSNGLDISSLFLRKHSGETVRYPSPSLIIQHVHFPYMAVRLQWRRRRRWNLIAWPERQTCRLPSWLDICGSEYGVLH